MGKYDKKKRGFAFPVYILRAMPVVTIVAGIALLCLIGGIVAHYVTQTTRGGNQIGAKDFYFAVDLLAASEDYGDPDENLVVTRDFHLYGGGQNTLAFQVQNHFDQLRVSGMNIHYTLSWELKAGSGTVSMTKNGAAQGASTVSGDLTGGSKDADDYVVVVDDAAEGTTVAITVTSVNGENADTYTKKMTLNMILHPQKYDVLYRVEDEPGAPFANLVVMVGKENGISYGGNSGMLLDWSTVNATANILQVDTTDKDIIIVSQDGQTLTVDDVESGLAFSNKAMITRDLLQGESISIYFFKTDPGKDYSQENTVVEADANGDYIVTITENK